MKKLHKEMAKSINPVIKEYGFTFESIIKSKKHYRIIMRHESGESRFVVCSVSPSCRFALKAIKGDCKRTCRDYVQKHKEAA